MIQLLSLLSLSLSLSLYVFALLVCFAFLLLSQCSFMLCMFTCFVCLFSILFCFVFHKNKNKKIEKLEKYKNSVYLCILVFVYLRWPLKQSFLNSISLVI